MVAVPPLHDERVTRLDEDQRFVLHGVPWAVYVALRDALDDDDAGSRVRMTYLDGSLELMSPSSLHEEAAAILARLLEMWSLEHDVDLRGFRSTTFRAEVKKRGLEPDECYKLGALAEGDVPDIAIEMIVTRPILDKLSVYAGLGVREVWVWKATKSVLVIHQLVDDAYVVREGSAVLPDLDVPQLVRFVRPGESHLELVKSYVAELRAR